MWVINSQLLDNTDEIIVRFVPRSVVDYQTFLIAAKGSEKAPYSIKAVLGKMTLGVLGLDGHLPFRPFI